MSTGEISVLLETPMLLGECPLWDPNQESLFWIDIAGKSVHRFVPESQSHRCWPLPSEPGCIALCQGEKDRLVVAMRSGIAFLSTKDGSLAPILDAPYDPSRYRFNDGRCDANGRLWVGTLYDPRDKPAASLYCLERGQLRDVHHPVTVSNGIAFSTDHCTLFQADTSAHRISAYDFDLTNGQVGKGRLFMQFSSDRSTGYGGRPDGAAVDSEGAYWCSMYEGGRILRISPEGKVLREITLPVKCPTMIAFGGKDLRTLFITTVRHNRQPEEMMKCPLSGCVLCLQVDIHGLPEHAYIA